jgi:HEAT repeat protein
VAANEGLESYARGMALASQPSQTAPPAKDPMDDPVTRDKIDLAKTFAFQLLKGIKQIGMYRHQESRFEEFLHNSHVAIDSYTHKFGPLSLKVETQNFSLLGQHLFAEDSPLPYKFFRDGIRQLIFRPELELHELVQFTLISLSDPERGAEEIMAQLWKAQLPHLEYVAVEGFKFAEFSEEEVQVEVDQVVSYLYSRLRSNSDDFMRFARLSAEDLESDISEIEQLRGAVIQGETATDDLKARIQREVQEEETNRLFPKLVSAVFQVVEGGLEDPQLVEEMLVQLLDALLLQEDVATINQIVLKLRAMEKSSPSDALSQLRQTFTTRMGEEQRLTRVGEILKNSLPKNPADLTRYLQALGTEAVPVLLNVLETIDIPESRHLLCDSLAPFATEVPEPFVNRLQSEKPQIVRDMVYILEKCHHPHRIKLFGQVLKHDNLAIRLEAMSIIAKGRTGESRKLISDCLGDENSQVRSTAARLLPEFDRERAFMDLSVVLKSPHFEKKPPDERAAFYAALGSTGVPSALTLLGEMLKVKPSLLNKKKVLDDKLLAVRGLGATHTVQAYKLLQELVEDKSQPPEVLMAARKAMYQTKKTLFGEHAPGAPPAGGEHV